MRLPSSRGASVVAATALLALALCACRPRSPEAPPAPVPPEPEVSAPAQAAPPATLAPAAPGAPAASAQVAVVRTAAPDLATMQLAARGSSKIGVPVELRYQFEGAIEAGRPVTLHLAAVPHVAGTNLEVTVTEVAGIRAMAAPLHAQKADAATAYRQSLTVTRESGGPAELRVLVTMEVAEGSAHSFFSVPLVPQDAAPAGKR